MRAVFKSVGYIYLLAGDPQLDDPTPSVYVVIRLVVSCHMINNNNIIIIFIMIKQTKNKYTVNRAEIECKWKTRNYLVSSVTVVS